MEALYARYYLAWIIVYTFLFAIAGAIIVLLDGVPLIVAQIIVLFVSLYILITPQEVFLNAWFPSKYVWSATRSQWVHVDRNITAAGQRGGAVGVFFGVFPFGALWMIITDSSPRGDEWLFMGVFCLLLLLVWFISSRSLSSSFEKRWHISTFLGALIGYIVLLFVLLLLQNIPLLSEWLFAVLGGAAYGFAYALTTILLLPWVQAEDPIRYVE